MHRLGVLGWPVAHSRSPAMQNAALAAAGLRDWHYQRLPVPPELFEETVRGLPGAGFVGANVTIPHKEAALALADEATPAATAIGAANTLSFSGGRILADNTDAPGLLTTLPWPVAGRRALVLGAGGSARAAAWALKQAGAVVVVHNRTAERAHRLASDVGVQAVAALDTADLLVHCTSLGLAGEPLEAGPVPPGRVADYACVVDLVYAGRGDTALVAAAKAAGRATVDGLAILVAQGALSFEHWTGVPAPRDVMAAAARGTGPAPP